MAMMSLVPFHDALCIVPSSYPIVPSYSHHSGSFAFFLFPFFLFFSFLFSQVSQVSFIPELCIFFFCCHPTIIGSIVDPPLIGNIIHSASLFLSLSVSPCLSSSHLLFSFSSSSLSPHFTSLHLHHISSLSLPLYPPLSLSREMIPFP